MVSSAVASAAAFSTCGHCLRSSGPSIRTRMVSSLANVAEELAQGVAEGLGIDVPEPMPKAIQRNVRPEVKLRAIIDKASK